MGKKNKKSGDDPSNTKKHKRSPTTDVDTAHVPSSKSFKNVGKSVLGDYGSISEGEINRKENVGENRTRKLLELSLSHLRVMNKYTNLCFSWADKRPDIIAEHYQQTEANCWAVALYRQWYALMRLAKRKTEEGGLTITSIMEGVEPYFRSSENALRYLESAIPFMEQYVRMRVYHRPPKPLFDGFETFVGRLLSKNPVVVTVMDYKSYNEVKYQGVLSPTELQRTADLYCQSSMSSPHCVLLVGEGVAFLNGQTIPYWLLYNSMGYRFGESGFIRLAKHLGLILEVVDMELIDDHCDTEDEDEDDGEGEDEDDPELKD